MTLTVLAVNLNSPSRERAERQLAALVASRADVLVLTEVKRSAGGDALVGGLRGDGYSILGWEAVFEGFTTLIATKVPTKPALSPPGRVQRVTLESTPSVSILAAYGVSSDPFRRGTEAKIADKREWLRQFAEQVRQEVGETENLLVIGDLNFVDDRRLPQYRSIYDFEKRAYSDMLSAGLTDLLAGSDEFTWTSHRGQGFRYDHAFSSESLRPHVVNTLLEHQWRIGEERVTDHSAVRVETALTFTPDRGELAVSDKNPTQF